MPETKHQRKPTKKKHQKLSPKIEKSPPPALPSPPPPPPAQPSAPPHQEQPTWVAMKSIFSCKHLETKEEQKTEETKEGKSKRSKKMVCSGSFCSNTRVMQRPDSVSPQGSKKWGYSSSSSSSFSSISGCNGGSTSKRSTLSKSSSPVSSEINNNNNNNNGASSSSNTTTTTTNSSSSLSTRSSGSFRGMHLRRFSGCYECRMVVDPSILVSRDPSLRNTLSSCPNCGEAFMKTEDLELHQSIRHAVSELGPEDSSKNIVEIIFQSSWLKKQAPICKIDRILKVNNTQKTITRFEDYRESIKAKATKLMKKHPRCVADGNELLRFHCTTFVCSIGINGSTNLCNSIPQCNVCSIIKNGFKIEGNSSTTTGGGGGICTTATSGKAHDNAKIKSENEKRAMLVCRVIAGKVKKNQDGGTEEFDSVAGTTGIYSDLDELLVFNAKAILPCFVVIYGGF